MPELKTGRLDDEIVAEVWDAMQVIVGTRLPHSFSFFEENKADRVQKCPGSPGDSTALRIRGKLLMAQRLLIEEFVFEVFNEGFVPEHVLPFMLTGIKLKFYIGNTVYWEAAPELDDMEYRMGKDKVYPFQTVRFTQALGGLHRLLISGVGNPFRMELHISDEVYSEEFKLWWKRSTGKALVFRMKLKGIMRRPLL